MLACQLLEQSKQCEFQVILNNELSHNFLKRRKRHFKWICTFTIHLRHIDQQLKYMSYNISKQSKTKSITEKINLEVCIMAWQCNKVACGGGTFVLELTFPVQWNSMFSWDRETLLWTYYSCINKAQL